MTVETPAQTCVRLAAALEELVAQEASVLAARDFAAAINVRERIAPLIEHLVAHRTDVVEESDRVRIMTAIAGRKNTVAWLTEQIELTKEALRENDAGRLRVNQFAPAYGVPHRTLRLFSALG